MSTSAADTIAKIFSQNLPTLPSDMARDFACAFRAYHAAFNALRGSAMKYEALLDYQSRSDIMQVPCDQFWPYSPHFKKIVALAIEYLFKTKVTGLGTCSVVINQTLVFVDDVGNRWIMRVEESLQDDKLIRILMYFPRSNSPLYDRHGIQRTPVEHLIDTDFLKENNLGIITEDLSDLLGRAANQDS